MERKVISITATDPLTTLIPTSTAIVPRNFVSNKYIVEVTAVLCSDYRSNVCSPDPSVFTLHHRNQMGLDDPSHLFFILYVVSFFYLYVAA